MKPLVLLDVDGVINDLGALYGQARSYRVDQKLSFGIHNGTIGCKLEGIKISRCSSAIDTSNHGIDVCDDAFFFGRWGYPKCGVANIIRIERGAGISRDRILPIVSVNACSGHSGFYLCFPLIKPIARHQVAQSEKKNRKRQQHAKINGYLSIA